MDMRQLSPDDLAAAGRVLYGAHWQRQLAQALTIGDRTLRRWLSLELPSRNLSNTNYTNCSRGGCASSAGWSHSASVWT